MLHVHVTSKSAVLIPSLDNWIRNVLIITIKVRTIQYATALSKMDDIKISENNSYSQSVLRNHQVFR